MRSSLLYESFIPILKSRTPILKSIMKITRCWSEEKWWVLIPKQLMNFMACNVLIIMNSLVTWMCKWITLILFRDSVATEQNRGWIMTILSLLKKSDWCDDEKSWTEFVATKLMPSSHATDITKHGARLLYDIVTRKTIDVRHIIQNGILRIATG